MIGLLPVTPPLVLAYVTSPSYGIAAAGFCLLLLGLGVSLREGPRWVRGIAVPYWILVCVIQMPFALLGFQTSPALFLLAAILLLATLLRIPRRSWRKWVLVAFVTILLATSAWELWDWSRPVALLASVLAVAAPAFTASVAARGLFTGVNRIAVGLFVFMGLLYAKGFLAYELHSPLAASRVLQQPGVSAVYDYRHPPFRRDVPKRTMFLAPVPGTDLFVVGPHDPYQEVLLVQSAGPHSHVLRLSLGGRGGDQALFHEDAPGTFVMAGRSQLLRIGVSPFRMLDTADLGDKKLPLNMVRYDPLHDRYFVIRAYDRDVYVVDRETFAREETLKAPPRSCYIDGWVDTTGGALILFGDFLVGGQVTRYDLATLTPKQGVRLPWDPLHLGVLDDQGRRLYVASRLRRSILVFDADTLQLLRRIPARYGTRNLNFDPHRRLLIAGDFFRGHILVYEVDDTERLIGRLFLGKQVRWVEVEPRTGKWYANSSAGGFSIEPDRAFSR